MKAVAKATKKTSAKTPKTLTKNDLNAAVERALGVSCVECEPRSPISMVTWAKTDDNPDRKPNLPVPVDNLVAQFRDLSRDQQRLIARTLWPDVFGTKAHILVLKAARAERKKVSAKARASKGFDSSTASNDTTR